MAANSVNKTPDSVSDAEKTPSPSPPPSPLPPPSDLHDKPMYIKGDTSPPHGWEQRLSLSLGEVYYVNKRTGERSSSAKADSESSFAKKGSAGDDDGGGVKGGSSQSSTTTTAASSAGETKPSSPPMTYLVAAGCLACRRYFMVAKGTEDCPMCSGELKAFDTEG